MASNGRAPAHENLPKLDPKLVSCSASVEQDTNPDVDPKTVSHPNLNQTENGRPTVDPKLVS